MDALLLKDGSSLAVLRSLALLGPPPSILGPLWRHVLAAVLRQRGALAAAKSAAADIRIEPGEYGAEMRALLEQLRGSRPPSRSLRSRILARLLSA